MSSQVVDRIESRICLSFSLCVLIHIVIPVLETDRIDTCELGNLDAWANFHLCQLGTGERWLHKIVHSNLLLHLHCVLSERTASYTSYIHNVQCYAAFIQYSTNARQLSGGARSKLDNSA